MQTFDLHVHTTFSDGANTPEEVILRAIDLGFSRIGISDHSYVKGAEEWCMKEDAVPKYRKAVANLKEKYQERIEVLCGIEQDLFSPRPALGFDYVIGSTHFLKIGKEFVPVDESADILSDAADKFFDGDIYKLTELYFAQGAGVVSATHADIVGHFDLITKFNEAECLFSETHPRYTAAWHAAVLPILAAHVPFEINFGAISRGYRTKPYPSKEIREFIRENGGEFVLSSDAHAAGTIGYGFAMWNEIE
ncbi:MAG TPA: histidinol-phosphatase [Methanocorpusculum sp.]|nr:histidinol-phosphatase [Methanocorpusculum sp.]